MDEKDEKLWGMLCHLSVFSGYIIPLGNIIAPLVIWLVKKDESDYVNYHGAQALNFQISIIIYVVVSLILVFIFIGVLMVIAVAIFDIIMIIIAAIKANQGERYKYPLCIPFIKVKSVE